MSVYQIFQTHYDLDGKRFCTGIAKVEPPVRRNDFNEIDERTNLIQFENPLSRVALQRLNEVFLQFPKLKLRIFTGYPEPEEFENLKFLRYLPNVRRLSLSLAQLSDYSGLETLIERLEHFELSCIRKKPKNIEIFCGATSITSIASDDTRILQLLPMPERLRHLRISSAKPDPVDFIPTLSNLNSLVVSRISGEFVSRLALPKALDDLHLFACRGESDLNFLQELSQLKLLSLECMKVSNWPDFSRLAEVRGLHINKSFQGFEEHWLGELMNLDELVLQEWPDIDIAAIGNVSSLANLKSFRYQLGKGMRRSRKDSALADMFPNAEYSHRDGLRCRCEIF